jgi:type I restriction enzyme M protein
MNKIIVILPNVFENKQNFKDLRKNIIDNYRVENLISLSEHSFQPYAMVNTVILNLTTDEPSDYFWKFKVKNDGYTLNRRREKKVGENDFDIFWKFKDSSEEKKIENGFQKLAIAEIKEQKDWEFTLAPDFSYLFRKPTLEELVLRKEEEKRIDLAILENWEKLKEIKTYERRKAI